MYAKHTFNFLHTRYMQKVNRFIPFSTSTQVKIQVNNTSTVWFNSCLHDIYL